MNKNVMVTLTASLSLSIVAVAQLPGLAISMETVSQSSIVEYLKQNPEIIVVDDSILNDSTVYLTDRDGIVNQIDFGSTTTGKNKSSSIVAPQAAAGCSYQNAVFLTTSWAQTNNGCGIIGTTSSARWVYDWNTYNGGWDAGSACMEGRGYYNATGSIVRWYSSGCGTSGSVSALIGNRATVAKMRGHILYALTIAYVSWR